MCSSDLGCIDGSHGTDLHSDADGSADDDADICRDFGGCDLRLKTRRGFHGRISADRFGRRSGLFQYGRRRSVSHRSDRRISAVVPDHGIFDRIGCGKEKAERDVFSVFGSRNRGKLCGRRCNVLCVDGRFGMDRNYSVRTAVYPDSRDQSRGGSDTRASGEEPACGSFADGIKMSRI